MRHLTIDFGQHADLYFRLRKGDADAALQEAADAVASAHRGLPPMAFLMIDPAVAGWERSWPELVEAAADLPDEIAGIPARRVISEIAAALATLDGDAVADLLARDRAVVEPACAQLKRDADALDAAVEFVADALGATLPVDKIPVVLVADGVPRGGLTSTTMDDRAVCFVATVPHSGSILHEAVVHESIHAFPRASGMDAGDAIERLLAGLRELGVGPMHPLGQVWHVPFFIAAADAARRFIDVSHRDYGDVHGYYAGVADAYAVAEQPWRARLRGDISVDEAVEATLARVATSMSGEGGD